MWQKDPLVIDGRMRRGSLTTTAAPRDSRKGESSPRCVGGGCQNIPPGGHKATFTKRTDELLHLLSLASVPNQGVLGSPEPGLQRAAKRDSNCLVWKVLKDPLPCHDKGEGKHHACMLSRYEELEDPSFVEIIDQPLINCADPNERRTKHCRIPPSSSGSSTNSDY